MGRIAVIVFIITGFSFLMSQKLMVPRNVQQAYTNQTRSTSGEPGAEYWQNQADYNIRVWLMPDRSRLNGEEIITYANNSPDTLSFIFFQLYQNMNKAGMARDRFLQPDARTGGMSLSRIAVEFDSLYIIDADTATRRLGTLLRVDLPQVLAPGDSVRLHLDWHMDIPGRSNMRMGQYDSTSFFLALFYPEVAVYDDVSGWDLHSYDAEHEFYTEYGDFNLQVTVPKNYMVWSTGKWQNVEDILPESLLKPFRQSQQADTIMHLVTDSTIAIWKTLKCNSDSITYKFSARQVPKVAFGCSNHYLWDASSVALESGRRVSVQAAYKPGARGFPEVVREATASIQYLSNTMPGVEYPYSVMTVFHGEDGMEFPMIVNDGDYNLKWLSMYVTAHEIAHTWFPFYVGINEFRYAWMDEGWAYFLPLGVQLEESGIDHVARAVSYYTQFAGTLEDVPLMTPTRFLRGRAVGVLNYFKPALAYVYLEKILGKEKFAAVLKKYIKSWKGKHPTPFDFFNLFNEESGENLNWFWNNWFFEVHYPDLSLQKVKLKGKKAQVTIVNQGGLFVPVIVQVHTRDGNIETFEKSPVVWEKNPAKIRLKLRAKDEIVKILVGSDQVPDVSPEDNMWEKK